MAGRAFLGAGKNRFNAFWKKRQVLRLHSVQALVFIETLRLVSLRTTDFSNTHPQFCHVFFGSLFRCPGAGWLSIIPSIVISVVFV
jgi:hypothetical protein